MRKTWVSVIKRVWICLVVFRRLLLHQLTDSKKKNEKNLQSFFGGGLEVKKGQKREKKRKKYTL